MNVASLRTAPSGACVDTAPSSAVRCTIGVLRKELRRIVFRVHVVNDTEEAVRCAPGTKRDGTALLQTELDLFCDPHAELGFLFAVPRFGRNGRLAFVRVSGTTFACGFETPIEDDALRVAAISFGISALFVALVAAAVFFERRRARARRAREQVHPPAPAPIVPVETVEAEVVDERAAPVALPENPRGVEARGFAAVFDDRAVVVGALDCTREGPFGSDFVAKVVNQTAEPVRCVLSGRTRGGEVRVAPGSFQVHPESAVAVSFSVPLRVPWRFRTLHLAMESATLRASTHANVPLPLAARVATVAGGSLLAVALFVAADRVARPSIAAFAVPARVIAGAPVTAGYALGGIGRGRYVVTSNGRRIASGTVSGSGSVTFSTSRRPARYVVDLRNDGPLGSAHERLVTDAVARVVTAAATIGALAVDPAVATAGAPVTVRYATNAVTGSVALLGAAGVPLERVALGARGTATLEAPIVQQASEYEVALDARGGGTTAHASVGLLVVPPTPAPQVSPQPPPTMLTAAQLFRLVPQRVAAGQPFALVLAVVPARLSLSLDGPGGAVASEQRVASTQRVVRFVAPLVSARQRWEIVARFVTGTAEQVVLAPIDVVPR